MSAGLASGRNQAGAVLPVLALSLIVLISLLALVFDLGRTYIAKTELQNAADASALAGAKALDGTASGIDNAVNMAIEAAGKNSFLGNTGHEAVTITSADIQFSSSPTGAWLDAGTAKGAPADKGFIKVDTGTRNLTSWFAPIMDIVNTAASGMAVAGRYPPGALAPMFVPAVRRNTDQASSNASPPYCNGVTYDPKDKNLKKNTCPYDPVNGGLVPYRVPDNTGNWGFLKANESKTYPSFNGIADGVGAETGNYYVITQVPNNNASSVPVWSPGTPWNGNFGFILESADAKTLKDLAAALCRGGSIASYTVPGCGPVHPGNLSGPKMASNLNTRFDLQDNQTVLPHSACQSDTNIYDPGSTHWASNGYYKSYLAGSPLVSPTNYPPGQANRRLVNVYVIDNAWLPGDNLAGSADDACYASPLSGGSQDAHLVGCAKFFMWTAADKSGKLYAEYVERLPASQCASSVGTYRAVRLYQ